MKLNEIHLNPDNPRLIKDDKFKKLVASIKDFPKMMELRPIIVDDTMTILGGNMRYNALREAGYEEIPDKWVKKAEDLTEKEKQQFIIKDNLPFGEWDWDILGNNFEIKDLLEWGFDEKDLKIDQEIEEDEAPEVSDEPAVSKLGEVYQLGRHRLMCGDSTKIEDVEKLMDGKKADMVFTDPPYGVDYSGGTQFKKNGVVEKNHREKLINDDSPEIYDKAVPIMAEFNKGPIYTWFGSSKAINIFQAVAKVGEIHSIIVWVKGGGSGDLNSNYKQKHEMCMYWKPKGGKLNFIGPNNETNVWEVKKDGVNEYHPTQKPIEICARAIRNHKAEIVLDLFGGSGSTLIACEQTNRTCYMMEIDPKYTDVIRKRYSKFVGKEDEWQTITLKI